MSVSYCEVTVLVLSEVTRKEILEKILEKSLEEFIYDNF